MSEDPKRMPSPLAATRRKLPRSAMFAAALVAAAVVGAGAETLVQKTHRVTLVALSPEPVSALKDGTMAAIKGDVDEIFGNKFVVGDGSGRALVETGRFGEGSPLVGKGEAVTVQGRFEHGFLHAAAITHADGHADMLSPPPPPPRPMGPAEAMPEPGRRPPL